MNASDTRSSRWPTVPACALMLVLSSGVAAQTTGPSGEGGSPPLEQASTFSQDRLIRTFDFDERPLGNYEPLPMRWTRHRAWGFPQYLEAGFDGSIGHDAPPSFRFDLNGGSIGFVYRARTIEVLPASDYVVFAWIRTETVKRARAFLRAGFLDRRGNPFPQTEQTSARVGGPADNGQWRRVSVHLTGSVRNARFIHLSLWLTQPGALERKRRGTPEDADALQDIHGTAWFDDVRVYRLPRVALVAPIPGHVFGPDDTPELRALVNDPDGVGLSADLVVADAGGHRRYQRPIRIHPIQHDTPDIIQLANLDPGVYQARLDVAANGGSLAGRSIQFAVLGPRQGPTTPERLSGRGFGVALARSSTPDADEQVHLLQHLGVEWIKVPVWSVSEMSAPAGARARSGAETYLAGLASQGFELVGWIAPERYEVDRLGTRESLLDVITAPPEMWQPRLAYVWSLYGGLIQWWQLGNERDASLVWDPRLPSAVNVVRDQMRPLLENPHIVMPTNVLKPDATPDAAPPATAPTQSVSAFLSAMIPPEQIAAQWPDALDAEVHPVWVTVEPLPPHRYARLTRLADLVKRLICVRTHDPTVTFLREPWERRSDGAKPSEDYVVFRAVADVLGGTRSAGQLTIDRRTQAYVFDRGGRAVLAVWDDYAPRGGRTVWLPAPQGARQIDPWGRTRTLEAPGTEQAITVGPVPTFVESLPTWVTRFHQSFALDPPRIEARLAPHNRTIRFTNPSPESISGDLRLVPPRGWSVEPARFRFALASGASHEQTVTLRFPLNEPAGAVVLLGEFDIQADQHYRLRIPAWLDLGLDGIDVDTFAKRVGDNVVVRQSITNRTSEPVSFYGYLAVADRERLHRVIANLRPGDTMTKQYVLGDASALAGHRMRVGLREVNGPRIWNRLLEIP
jgi:hypothetical protein